MCKNVVVGVEGKYIIDVSVYRVLSWCMTGIQGASGGGEGGREEKEEEEGRKGGKEEEEEDN